MRGLGAAAPTAVRVHQNCKLQHQNCKLQHILKDENRIYRLLQNE